MYLFISKSEMTRLMAAFVTSEWSDESVILPKGAASRSRGDSTYEAFPKGMHSIAVEIWTCGISAFVPFWVPFHRSSVEMR